MTLPDLRRIWFGTLRLYFAPLLGAVRGSVQETRKAYREVFGE